MRSNSGNRGRNFARLLTVLGVLLLLGVVAQPALAHDNLGGDDLSGAYAILVSGMVALAGAAIAIVWAIRAGQFNNVEEPKYTMLDNAPDLDDLPIFGENRPISRPKPQPRNSAGQRP